MTLALEARGIRKRYGALVAVDDGQFELARGEVHVLLGSNGCGKSTLCKIMAGSVAGDSGSVTLEGRETSFRSPMEAKAAGIATIYQELSLIPTLTVAQNIVLGAEPVKGLGIDRAAARETARSMIASVGDLAAGLDPDALVGHLPIDRQQIVEILKGLAIRPKVVLFDESTSSLDRAQVAAFFALVRRLKADGVSIIFISHRMEEIFAIGDRVTVMRNGRYIATRRLAETTRDELVSLMVGAAVEKGARRAANEGGAPLLVVDRLSAEKLRDISLSLRAGEVLGLGGLHGQGQSDLLLTLYGAKSRRDGAVTMAGKPAEAGNPLAALKLGLTYVSGDRGRAGSLHGRPILENFALAKLAKQAAIVANRTGLAKAVGPLVERLKLKFGGFADAIGTLSGGNQQKVILGRALAAEPLVLLLDDPTKGIDVQAKRDLYTLMNELCAAGAAVILYSSEDSELLDNADRVLVFNGGAIVDELTGARLTEFDLYSSALKSAA